MTIAAPTERVRRLRAPGYVILCIAMVLPLVDMFMSVMPMKPAMVAWRFGTVGLFASAVGAPLLVLFLIYVLALSVGDLKVVVVCGAVAALLALLLIGGTGTFALDALQMKARVQAAGLPRFYTASAQAVIKLILQGIASVVLAISIFRTVRNPRLAAAKPERNPAANLLVGRSMSTRPIDRGEHAGAPRASADGAGSVRPLNENAAITPATTDE